METGNGECDKNLLEFIKPIKIGVEDLNPVEIYFLIVQKEKPDEDNPPVILLSLDVITQYDVDIRGNKYRSSERNVISVEKSKFDKIKSIILDK